MINWAADNQLVIASEEDGWQHLYALSADGGKPKLLTPGDCEVEQWSFTPGEKTVLFNSNCNDIDRRHLWSVDVTGAHLSQWEKLRSIYWSPVALSDGKTIAFLGSDANVPATPRITTLAEHATVNKVLKDVPEGFPADDLIEPEQVKFKSGDGGSDVGGKSGQRVPAGAFPLSIQVSTNLIRNTDRGALTADAELVHRGKSTMVADVRVTDDQSRLIARATVTLLVPKPPVR